jgi:class 3 adenylate cyclase/tetratricopeptide (TPR) repeat protein
MSKVDEEVLRIEAAIAAQESLRTTLGDAVVDVTVSALRARLEACRAEHRTGASDNALLDRLQRYIPRELAEKMRVLGHIEGERKRVSVLFADLSGFTALGERLDAEELTSLTNDALHELATAVYQYEGYIDKFVGDAVMAVFGAPIAHEDDPERALRAALAMRERLMDFNRRWSERLGQPLSVHIGINTGEVIAGNVGSDLRLAYTVMGDTVNTAARLQDAARSGQIFVSRETWRLTHAAFDFTPLEPLTVKGKREPLPAYELVRARLLPAKTRGLHELSPAFVGRQEELNALLDASRGLEDGHGAIITLAGEAGIGKSRLLAEWRQRLGERVRWLEGRCFAHTVSLSFGPFLDLLRRKVGITGEQSEAEARAWLHETMERVFPGDLEAHAIFTHLLALRPSPQEEAVLAHLPAQSLRLRLFSLVERYYARLAQRRPTVLVIEDLQWTDTSSLELLEHLFAVTGRTQLIVVCTFRHEREGAPAELLAHLEAHHRELHVSRWLGPLSETHSTEMVERLLSTPELPEALRALISRRAEGNPFFVEELLRSLIDRGVLVRGGGGWSVTPLLHTLKVPDTLQGVLMARLDRLPAETKWLAQQASVIGRIFLYRVLAHLAGSTATTHADLGHLEREDLIRERTREPELEYIFKHALTQDVAYQSLLAPRRKELHRKVGEVLESLFTDRVAEFRSVIGDHYLRGEAWEQAVTHLIAAGEAAARLYAHAEVRVHSTKALEALSHLPDTEGNRRRRVDTTLGLLSASFLAVPPEQNLQRMREAEQLALSLRTSEGGADQERLARVHYWMGRLHVYQGAYREALVYFQHVLQESQGTRDEALLAIPSFMVGRVKLLQGYFGQAEPLLARALEPLARAGEQVNWLWTVGFRALTLSALGEYRTALTESARILERAREENDIQGIAFCCLGQAHISMMARDTPRMVEHSHAAIAAAEQTGDRVFSYIGISMLAWAQSRLGQHEEAAANAARRDSLMGSMGRQLLFKDWFAASDAERALNEGRWADAQELATQTLAEAHAADGIFAQGLAERVLAQALAAQERWPEAEPHLRASLTCFETGAARLEAAHTHVIWAELLGARGQVEAAREHLLQALATYEKSGIEGELARARRLLDALPRGATAEERPRSDPRR